jgi:N-ethylmaleimide reductase
VCEAGRGFANTPGIYNDAQVVGWRKVTDAVHASGGLMYLQLWHQGRTAFEALGPSAVPVEEGGPAVRAIPLEEIAGLVALYREAAARGLAAGFDGVEVHAANGYLPDEFLQTSTNLRTDAYGCGSLENRARFLMEVTDACIGVWGADRVGVRISPASHFGNISSSDPVEIFSHVARELGARKIAYLHVVEPRINGNVTVENTHPVEETLTAAFFKPLFKGPVLSAGGYDKESAEAALTSGAADAIVFGRHFVSNPDLVQRLKIGAPLAPHNRDTL